MLEIRPDEKDRLSCLVCEGTKNLHLYAHRNRVKIVGFLIVCEDCFMLVGGREIKVEVYRGEPD